MPKEIEISHNKTLKLTNVLFRTLQDNEFSEFGKIVELMEDYIKAKGSQPLGPLIQYSATDINEDGQVTMRLTLMRQSNNYINRLESPYMMESVIRVKNCLYTRFIGEESHVKFAYDKLGVVAYENEIKPKGDSYTIFVDSNDDVLTADIFMECIA